MNLTKPKLEEFFKSLGVEFRSHTELEGRETDKLWLQTFAIKVKKETGSWIYNDFRWHGLSWETENAVGGEKALEIYLSQWPAPFIVFDEGQTWSYLCNPASYPDFSEFGADIYVSHHNMKWTMAFTHEQPDIGPFFLLK